MKIINHVRWIILLLLISILSNRTSIQAQEFVEIVPPSNTSVAGIDLQLLLTLGNEEEGPLLSRFSMVWTNSKGWFIIAPVSDLGVANIYDGAGNLQTIIGRSGQGPGEYINISRISISRLDSIHIFDDGSQKQSILSPSFEYIRSVRIPFMPFKFAMFDDGSYIAAKQMFGRDTVGYPLHFVSNNGSIIRSFGNTNQPVSLSDPYPSDRSVALAEGDRFWAGFRSRYQIDLWNVSGTKVASYRRQVNWFKPWIQYSAGQPDQVPPQPTLYCIHQEANGTVGVLISVSADDWKRGPDRSSDIHRPMLSMTEDQSYFYTMIEYFDPQSGQLIASGRSDFSLGRFCGDRMIWSKREDEEGRILIDIWRVIVSDH